MKRYGIALAVAAAIIAAVVGWQLTRSKEDVASSLPQDLTMVARIDFPSLAIQYGLNGKDAGRIVQRLLWHSEKNVDGVDYLNASYAFATQGYFGTIVPLSDSDRFRQFVQEARSCRFEQQRGLSWAVVDYNMLLAVSDDRAMLMGPAVGAELDALRNTIASCLKQKAEQSGMQSELYGMLDSRQEPVVLATTYGALPQQAHIELLDSEIDLSSLCATAGITLHRDKASIALSLSSRDTKINALLDKLNDALQPVSGNLLESAPTPASLHVEAGIRGEQLLTALRSIPSVRTKLLLANAIMDVDMMLRCVDGDVSFSTNRSVATTQVTLRDTRILDNVGSWNDELTRAAGIRFEDKGGHKGSVRYKGKQLYYAADGQRLVLSRDEDAALSTGHHDLAYPWAAAMDGQRFFAMYDVSQSILSAYLKHAERIIVTSSDIRQWNIELSTKNGSELLDLAQ